MKPLSQRLTEFAAIAVKVGRDLDYPPALLIAQWAIESAWGSKQSGKNNYFGMTRAFRHGDKWAWVPTREVLSQAGINRLKPEERAEITSKMPRADGKYDVKLSRQFATYPTLMDGVLDKVNLIQNGAPYKAMFAAYRAGRDLNKLIDSLAPVYATDPGYGKLIKTIAAQKNVRLAIAAVEGAEVVK